MVIDSGNGVAREHNGNGNGDGCQEAPWFADATSVSLDQVLDDEGRKCVSVLRHPTHPFVRHVPQGADLDKSLRKIADEYITSIRALAQLDDAAVELLLADASDGFGWLDLAWGDESNRDPGLSFWVTRRDEQGAALDRTAVLLAANRHLSGDRQRPEGMAVGLSVVMHVGPHPDQENDIRVRVTGASFSRLRWARKPDSSLLIQLDKLTALQTQAQSAFGFDQTAITGFSTPTDRDGQRFLQMAGIGSKGSEGAERVYAWRADVVNSSDGDRAMFVPGELVEQVSHMAPTVPVFATDPASHSGASTEVARRPTRRAADLDPLRTWNITVPDPIRHPGGFFEVRQSVVADRKANPSNLQALPPGTVPELRSDQLSAAHAYARAEEFFERFAAYGLPAPTYFKEAQLPLVLHHRAWFYSQPDGQTVNAEVRYSGQRKSLSDPNDELVRPQLAVRFGAANLTHRQVLPNDHGQARAQPMGLAADPRWAWHEFGHVLAFASTGALEFPFAHSAGDALAAIIADPDSHLAHQTGPGTKRAGMSGYTFPWVLSSRRHDRQAMEGWCWCGRRNKARHARWHFPPALFNGYTEEQMLSSSLFMFYRCIGGDTWGAGPGMASARRSAASDYAVYLIMRAMALLGPSSITPASSVDVLVSALIQADIGTTHWHVTGKWRGATIGRPMHRVGGTAHKVVRWAFEQQGLYATPNPNENVEGPGQPPPVDVYIAGLQDRGNGGYAPVSLGWTTDPSATAPGWYASPAALTSQVGLVKVIVGNRGNQTATNVVVRAWAADANPSLTWHPLNAKAHSADSLSDGNMQAYHFEAKDKSGHPLRGPWMVLVEVSCPGDRSNLDPSSGLPCSGITPPGDINLLTDLVANDNNLGLRAIDFG